MKKTDRKPNIALYAAGILLCLTLLSVYVTTGLYAKYISSSSTSESAHTASFYLEAKGDLLKKSFIIDNAVPGTTIEKELRIINKSEVKMKYTLFIQNETKNLPLVFEFTDTDTHDVYTSVNGECTIEKELVPGESLDHYTMNVIWEVSDEMEDENLQYMGMVDHIVITIQAEQMD